jgi:hypothetical protein
MYFNRVERVARKLGISTYELFVRAHRSHGFGNRGGITREHRKYERGEGVPSYVSKFCIAEETK